MYPVMRSCDVAARIGRTKSAVDHMASRLKLQKNPQSFYEIRSDAGKARMESRYNGYSRTDKKGYVLIHTKDGMEFEHRYLMEQMIGRKLTVDEDVHHINGDKADNRIENLTLMPHGEHTAYHNKHGRFARCRKYS